MLKRARPEVKIIAAEPANAAVLSGNPWSIHQISGWAPNFVPTVLERSVIVGLVLVDEVEGRDTARRLAAKEGIFIGLSAGATVATALRIAEDAPEGSVLLAMLPDTEERYLSTFLPEGANEESDDEWLASLEDRINKKKSLQGKCTRMSEFITPATLFIDPPLQCHMHRGGSLIGGRVAF